MIRKSSLAAATLLTICCILLLACGHNNNNQVFDSPIKGIINISVDESFKPVIEQEIKVYEGSYPNTQIIAHYKPEAECIKDMLYDSATRMVIITRGLNTKEEHYFLDSLSYVPLNNAIATDAVTIVVNGSSTDTVFSTERLRNILSTPTIDTTKKIFAKAAPERKLVVFDGLKETSTVRFTIDSILHGGNFDTSVVKAVKTSRDVLEYVANNPNAIGFVGLSWIGNPEDSSQRNMLKKVKIAYVQCDKCSDSVYVKPTQDGILSQRYPLVRGLYYIVKENYLGLGTGFANFLQYERGQLIFRRAYIWPKMEFSVRNVKMNQKL